MRERDDRAAIFARHLGLLIEVTGISYGDLERRSGRTGRRLLKHTTLNDHVRGNRKKLPKWDMVREIIAICKSEVPEEAGGPDSLGTEDQWWELYSAVKRGDNLRKSPIALEKFGIPPDIIGQELLRPSSAQRTETQNADDIGTPAEELITAAEANVEGSVEKVARIPPAADDRANSVFDSFHAGDRLELYDWRLPAVGGEGTSMARVEQWYAKEGDFVTESQPLVRILIDDVSERLRPRLAGSL